MAKVYDPKADYVCVKGRISLKDPKTNNRTLVTPETQDKAGKKLTFSLPHLKSHEVAFLVEHSGIIRLAGGKN